jgi:hypothetical protein
MRYYSINGIPYLSKYLQDMKFSIEGLAFNDIGLGFDYHDFIEKAFNAVGIGIQFQVPYLETIHVTAGWTIGTRLNEPDISGGLGVTF